MANGLWSLINIISIGNWNNMPKKKTIFFDAAGTLFYVAHGVGYHYSRIAGQYGVRVDAREIDQRFHEVYEKSSPLANGKAEKEWWHDRVRHVFEGITFLEFDTFFEEIYSFFQQGHGEEENAWTLFPETMEVLEHIHAMQHPIGLISNFDSRIDSILKNLKIFHFFQTVTTSSEAGFAKPSARIFQLALKKAHCAPSDAIHIGDHLVFDVEGAKNAGILAILVDRSGRDATCGKQPSGINVIGDLRETYKII